MSHDPSTADTSRTTPGNNPRRETPSISVSFGVRFILTFNRHPRLAILNQLARLPEQLVF
jgi:hypothetical protein